MLKLDLLQKSNYFLYFPKSCFQFSLFSYNDYIIFIIFAMKYLFAVIKTLACWLKFFCIISESIKFTIRVASIIGLSVCLSVLYLFSVLCYIFFNPTAVWYMVATRELRGMWFRICAWREFKKTWYFDANCNECDDKFLLRVMLRTHIRSRPLKPAPATFWFLKTI